MRKGGLKILKASAGTGKTFNLAKTYISLLLESDDPYAYRHILAVTFTNAATDEMKSRIIKELDILSRMPSKSKYHDDFVPSLVPDDSALSFRSGRALRNILHDYGAFSVTTIDKFFQQTLRAFAREVGRFNAYQVELDRDSLIEESVDRVLDEISPDDKETLDWLGENVTDSLEQGVNYNMEKKLCDMARRILSREYRSIEESFGIDTDKAFSKENLSRVRKFLRSFRAGFEKRVRERAQDVLDAFAGCGISVWETSDAKKYFGKMEEWAGPGKPGNVVPPTDAFKSRASDYQKWFKAADKARMAGLEGDLTPSVNAFFALFGDPYRDWKSAGLMLGYLGELGMAESIRKGFDALTQEKNVLSIDDSDELLKKIIGGSDAPFIYEKTGVRYDHFLLDEFQDTSAIQMENFAPLLRNSISQGHSNLVVGDVKQSIYRWRGADWKLMQSGLAGMFGEENISGSNLRGNYRSLSCLIDFFNGFFAYASKSLSVKDSSNDNIDLDINDIYGMDPAIPDDRSQRVEFRLEDPSPGSVEAVFCDSSEECGQVLSTINRLVGEQGARLGDIAVLVRTNRHGSEVASFLSARGIPVISNDSLHLKSSSVVRKVVSLLSLIEDPESRIRGWDARNLSFEGEGIGWHSLMELCEALLRIVRDADPAVFESQARYVQSFMDKVKDYCAAQGNEPGAFLEWWDGQDPVLSSPEDPGSVRIMTVHKSKGLEFPYVIIPFLDSQTFTNSKESAWCCPGLDGTPLAEAGGMAFDVGMSSTACSSTCFESDWHRSLKMQFIDNLNIVYVAMTRAKAGLTVISSSSAKSNTFAALLKEWVVRGESGFSLVEEDEGLERFFKGERYDFSGMKRGKEAVQTIPGGYPSWSINPVDPEGNTYLRLRLKADAGDFFSSEGKAGPEASSRLMGILLHDIMSRVRSAGDLEAAVADSLRSGAIDGAQASEIKEILSSAMAAAGKGWFPEGGEGVLNEVPVIGPDGSVHRPDRVVITPEKVYVIDYKIRENDDVTRRYVSQVGRYVDLYKSMGYRDVEGWLWYLQDKETVRVK